MGGGGEGGVAGMGGGRRGGVGGLPMMTPTSSCTTGSKQRRRGRAQEREQTAREARGKGGRFDLLTSQCDRHTYNLRSGCPIRAT